VKEKTEQEDALVSIRRYVLWGGFFAAAFLVLVGGWVFTARISGAVIATGSVKVLSDVKKVQSSTGGVVARINVRDGEAVKAGQMLILLDETVARANLAIVEKSLSELHARRSRLLAERDGASVITFRDKSPGQISVETIAEIRNNETRLFQLRKTAYDGRKAQLSEQIAQTEQEVEGYLRQIESISAQQSFIAQELESVRSLWAQKLVPVTRLNALEREAARLSGEEGRLQAAVAQLGGKSAELKLAILQVDKELFSEVALELRDVDAKILEVEEQLVASRDQLDKLELVSPQDGIVHQLNVKTVGGFVGAGDVLMLIVPSAERLVIDVRLAPMDIDQVTVGSEVMLRFSAFNQRITPELIGKIDIVSADTTTEQQTGVVFYSARVSVSDAELSKLGEFSLLPGMPVEVFIKTGDRTVISILTKPVADQLSRAFRQD
jgi:HlyD family secretion protein